MLQLRELLKPILRDPVAAAGFRREGEALLEPGHAGGARRREGTGGGRGGVWGVGGWGEEVQGDGPDEVEERWKEGDEQEEDEADSRREGDGAGGGFRSRGSIRWHLNLSWWFG